MPFDHEQHAGLYAEKYRQLRDEYVDLCDVARQLLRSILKKDQFAIHSIDCRAKDVASFRLKAAKPDPACPTNPKYDSPLEQIKDLAGVRVITYVTGVIPAVVEAIQANFEVIETEDKGQDLFRQGTLGYQSVHLLVRFKEPRLSLTEYSRFVGRVSEIQVRTILQHAWAELEHDIRYKSVGEAPQAISRRFISLAGLIEIADREFQAIQDEDRNLREALRSAPETEGSSTPSLPPFEDSPGEPASELADSDLSPKELVLLGRYAEAVWRYSDLIAREPKTYTLYIGRARARFLDDDRAGALEDVATAETLGAPVATVRRLVEQIDLGVVTPIGTQGPIELVNLGNAALEAGDGERALGYFERAAGLGFEPIYCAIDQAMALIVLGRLREAQITLLSIRPHEGSFVEATVFALRLIVQKLAGKEVQLEHLSNMVRGLAFDISRSALRHLQSGLQRSAPEKVEVVKDVFSVLDVKRTAVV